MITDYSTLEYKDKAQKQRQNTIYNLLDKLPSFCADYERYMVSSTSIKTRMEYLQDIYGFFRFLYAKNPSIGSIKNISLSQLEKLNGFDFDEYNIWLMNYKFDKHNEKEKEKHNKSVTRRRKFVAIKSLFKFLYIRDFIACNPSEKAITPKIKKKKRVDIRILEDNECEAFLALIDQDLTEATNEYNKYKESGSVIPERIKIKPSIKLRDKAIVHLFLRTGLRVSELCAINCDNISPLGYINVIRKEDSEDEKTSDKVYLDDKVQNLLEDYIVKARDIIGADNENYDALFISSKHKRITPRAIEMIIKDYAERALGKGCGITPHKLRATFGTRYYAMTGDISATSTAMNHSSIEVTASYYLKEDSNAKKMGANVPI